LEAGDAELGGDGPSGFGLIASEKFNIDTEIRERMAAGVVERMGSAISKRARH